MIADKILKILAGLSVIAFLTSRCSQPAYVSHWFESAMLILATITVVVAGYYWTSKKISDRARVLLRGIFWAAFMITGMLHLAKIYKHGGIVIANGRDSVITPLAFIFGLILVIFRIGWLIGLFVNRIIRRESTSGA